MIARNVSTTGNSNVRAERQKEVRDEGEVIVGRDDLDEVSIVEAQQPIDRIAEGDEADDQPGEKQRDGRRESPERRTSSRGPSAPAHVKLHS